MDTESAREMIARNYRPRPKEEEMEPIERIAAAAEAYMAKATELEPLHTNLVMAQLNNIDSQRDPIPRAAYRRALARDAYMAALGGMPRVGMESSISIDGLVKEAELYALETVRRWDAFMAAVDAEGGE